MKRAATYGLIAVLAAALIGAGALGTAWLAGTTDGARWLMDAVSRHTPLTISARTIEGRLLDRLQLGGVRMALAPVEVAIERRISGACAAHQRMLAEAIKRARNIALLPYAAD